MKRVPFIPPLPHIEPPDTETLEKIKTTDYSKNQKVKKVLKEFQNDDKKLRRSARISWWKTNWIGIITLIATILTLIATIVFGLLQVLR